MPFGEACSKSHCVSQKESLNITGYITDEQTRADHVITLGNM
jgi:hypothetical protein